jgi:hypothetical protein
MIFIISAQTMNHRFCRYSASSFLCGAKADPEAVAERMGQHHFKPINQ